MNYYNKELNILQKTNRMRERKIYKAKLIDLASNDYLGFARKKKLFKKAYKAVAKEDYFAPKASLLVNGYSNIHQKFERYLCRLNGFESGIVVGSGFLANIALIESLVRKKDILFIDEEYHASGILATKLVQGEVITFKHNDIDDLKQQLSLLSNKNRIIIAIEGIYSMSGDLALKEFYEVANEYNSLLIVDEAHSSGVIGKNLLGWYDYHNLNIEENHIKMGTLGKAYGSYGAYILASKHIISFLENRAKPIVYSTAPSLFDIALAYENLKHLVKKKQKIHKKIEKRQKIVKKHFDIEVTSLIVPVVISNNERVLKIQKILIKNGFLVGAIRQPTVKQAIIRLIIKLDVTRKDIIKVINIIKGIQNG